MQEAGCVDTYNLTINRCTHPYISQFEPAQFELVGELFAIYSPIWQFAHKLESAMVLATLNLVLQPKIQSTLFGDQSGLPG